MRDMAYADKDSVRELLLNVSATDAPDSLLNSYISLADRTVVKDITIPILDDILRKSDSTKFYTSYAPIADIDFDAQVTKNDVKVYGWTNASDPSTKTELEVNTVYPREGLIVLTEEPSSTYVLITADYSVYEQEVDFELVKLASNLYTAYLYLIRQTALVAPRYAIGPLRIEYYMGRGGGMGREFPYMRFKSLYDDIIKKIRTKSVKSKRMKESQIVRKTLEELG